MKKWENRKSTQRKINKNKDRNKMKNGSARQSKKQVSRLIFDRKGELRQQIGVKYDNLLKEIQNQFSTDQIKKRFSKEMSKRVQVNRFLGMLDKGVRFEEIFYKEGDGSWSICENLLKEFIRSEELQGVVPDEFWEYSSHNELMDLFGKYGEYLLCLDWMTILMRRWKTKSLSIERFFVPGFKLVVDKMRERRMLLGKRVTINVKKIHGSKAYVDGIHVRKIREGDEGTLYVFCPRYLSSPEFQEYLEDEEYLVGDDGKQLKVLGWRKVVGRRKNSWVEWFHRDAIEIPTTDEAGEICKDIMLMKENEEGVFLARS